MKLWETKQNKTKETKKASEEKMIHDSKRRKEVQYN